MRINIDFIAADQGRADRWQAASDSTITYHP
jgi:hypothetical protein